MAAKNTGCQVPTGIEALLLFCGGAIAGLIVFMLVGGVWQVSHFWWVMAGTTAVCGLLAVILRLEFQETLNALLESLPWI